MKVAVKVAVEVRWRLIDAGMAAIKGVLREHGQHDVTAACDSSMYQHTAVGIARHDPASFGITKRFQALF